eukprot:TRINITY_DN11065_c0_g1_i1.p2 TRINITY_DN11065_c0_g1~~TRINITY_DN11065_c0_g1_i1.p2  ORF type:complete len:135 (+),score=36.02 TRINITY_DN11065_c0_g1_i1:154-558(+)
MCIRDRSMVRAPMTAVHDMLLRRWMDHHLRLPGSGSEKGPDGKPISALDDRRHNTIADGDFSKEVKLPDVSLFIQPLVKDGGSFGDTMRRGRQQHAPQPVSFTHLRAHETVLDLVCRLLLEKHKIMHRKYIRNT